LENAHLINEVLHTNKIQLKRYNHLNKNLQKDIDLMISKQSYKMVGAPFGRPYEHECEEPLNNKMIQTEGERDVPDSPEDDDNNPSMYP